MIELNIRHLAVIDMSIIRNVQFTIFSVTWWKKWMRECWGNYYSVNSNIFLWEIVAIVIIKFRFVAFPCASNTKVGYEGCWGPRIGRGVRWLPLIVLRDWLNFRSPPAAANWMGALLCGLTWISASHPLTLQQRGSGAEFLPQTTAIVRSAASFPPVN